MADVLKNPYGTMVDTIDSSPDDDGFNMSASTSHIERLGPILVQCLFSAIKTLQIYDSNNRATEKVLSRLLLTLEELAEADGRVTLAISTDLLLINDVRITVDSQSMGPVLFLIDEMKNRRNEEIDFAPEVTAEELSAFFRLFSLEPEGDDVFGALDRGLENAGVKNIRLSEWIERVKYLRAAKLERHEIREESNRAMSRAILFMGEVMRSIEQRRPIQLPKAHRITEKIADILQADETVLVGLSSIKDYDEYTFSHSVNVSVLSMLIAEKTGFPKSETAQLGVAALFHDIGKTHVPQSILNKPATLTDDEWMLMERHPMLGAIELSRVRSLRAVIDPIFVALQHHLGHSGQGYPKKPGAWVFHPYTQIITIADVFDAMTTPRVYRKNTLTPDRVLNFILQKSGDLFDPLIAKVFIRAMGMYPTGTVVELNTRERAVVVRHNDKTRFLHRPVVVLLGEKGPQGDPVDLARQENDGAPYRRTIVRSVHDHVCEAQKADCFISKST